jgi:hypothetical protein
VTLGYDVERTSKDQWKRIADHVGISPSALFDLMVENIELDDRGYPVWLPVKPAPDGELPIDSA